VLGNAFKQIFELLVNDEMPISLVFKMVGLLVPQALTFTMPWGILVAALIVFGRMSQDLELQAIREGLERNHGNKPKTAEELGISLKTLYNKLHQFHETALDRTG